MLITLAFNQESAGAGMNYISNAVQVFGDLGLQLQFSDTGTNNISLLTSMDGETFAEVYNEKGIRTIFSKPIRGFIPGMYVKVRTNTLPISGKVLTE